MSNNQQKASFHAERYGQDKPLKTIDSTSVETRMLGQGNPEFITWLDTFIEEKGIDPDFTLQIATATQWHQIPVGVVIEHIKIAPPHEQAQIKKTICMIDFKNGDVIHFFRHLAQYLANEFDLGQQ